VGRATEAIDLSRQAHDAALRLSEIAVGDPRTSGTLTMAKGELGRCLAVWSDDGGEGIRILNESADIARAVAEGDPANLQAKADLARCHLHLAYAHEMARQWQPAAESSRRALEILTELAAVQPDEPRYAIYRTTTEILLAQPLIELGELAEATRLLVGSLAVFEREAVASILYNHEFALKARAEVLLGRARQLEGDGDQAEELWRKALVTLEPALRFNPELVDVQDAQAKALLLLGRRDEAAPVVERLLAKGWRDPYMKDLWEMSGRTH
jgi:tetratricopeptide (TPR) repeat protein